ncbi:MAG: ATPase [Gammaproteobacteria bacterium]|jgi:vacuolar-type H+-ATPase subunit H|nr:ATPase [Gammaproteobacteria bacterium]MBT4606457.1 ATPase [Thiotrichales bacterium]MBT3472885.1 ATPase [Gammaproteobacteria bacterium]MBT3966624.1 ATPase [Gammaproteobacteria bacterium]MBT4079428.1 ATPase [Gammaproteobacteria bacterium]
MHDSLNDLLQSELEAEKIVQESEQQREQIKQQALKDGHAILQQFNDRLPELHQSFLDRANERAEQSIAELKLRYDEQNLLLRQLSEKHQQEAFTDALARLLEEDR